MVVLFSMSVVEKTKLRVLLAICNIQIHIHIPNRIRKYYKIIFAFILAFTKVKKKNNIHIHIPNRETWKIDIRSISNEGYPNESENLIFELLFKYTEFCEFSENIASRRSEMLI
ncbi:hypothetical protein Avbf_00634 [Armadillidium vulgare]|nr:hypothetical protein Avbf_00634 [Armadillidium vulgare]